MTTILRIAATIALLVAVAACSAAPGSVPANPAVDASHATEIARRALDGFNAGDYAAWTRDWSDAMRAAIKATDFAAARDQIVARYGRYVSLGTPTLGSKTAGYYNWRFPVTFEKGTGSVAFGFKGEGPLVEGVFFE